DRIKLADGSRKGTKAFFIQTAGGEKQAFEVSADGFRPVSIPVPADPVPPLSGGAATQSPPPETPLAVDFDGDGVNETVQRAAEGTFVVLKSPRGRNREPAVVARIEGAIDAPVFADLDGDGRVEVIAVRMGDAAGPEVQKQPCLEVSKPDGRLLWRR